MKGYKVFNPDWTTKNGFQWKVGETYKHNGKLEICESGFHFCKKLTDCFIYYDFNPKNKFAEVEALGNIEESANKCITNKLKIVREIPWDEVLTIVNAGRDNTGIENTGDDNSGSCNTGDHNSGSCNTGNSNRGDRNSGNYNSGYFNAGTHNSGLHNTGNYNTGDFNVGTHNSGSWNTGCYNSGNSNEGSYNSGNYNSGHNNTGHCNTGSYNTGNYNSGFFNTCDHSTGFFNTESSTVFMFNKPCDLTWDEINNLPGIVALQTFKLNKWIDMPGMSDEEKTKYPEYTTTGGYLKKRPFKKAFKEFWSELNNHDRQAIKDLPNFDPEIFKSITGVKVSNSSRKKTDKIIPLTIVTLCGSHRFYDEFIELKNMLESSGIYHVLTPEIFNFVNPSKLSEDTHKKLDELHQAKMKISDYVLIINKGGYIGKDTQAEIDWCNANGIPVKYLEN